MKSSKHDQKEEGLIDDSEIFMPSQNTTFDNNLVGPLNEQSKSFLNNIQTALNDQINNEDFNQTNLNQEVQEEDNKKGANAKPSRKSNSKLPKNKILSSPKCLRLKSADREEKAQRRDKLHN